MYQTGLLFIVSKIGLRNIRRANYLEHSKRHYELLETLSKPSLEDSFSLAFNEPLGSGSRFDPTQLSYNFFVQALDLDVILAVFADGMTTRQISLETPLGEIYATPTPATHAIWMQLKAGDTVYQADKIPTKFQNTFRTT